MRRLPAIFLLMMALSALGTARAAETAAADPLAAELAALHEASRRPPPPGATRAELTLAWDRLCLELAQRGWAIYEKYPEDPRRWEAINLLRQTPYRPRYITTVRPDFETAGDEAIETDVTAAQAWNQRIDAVELKMRRAPDVPENIREHLESGDLIFQVLNPALRGLVEHQQQPDWQKLDAEVDRFLARWPETDATGTVSYYLHLKKLAGEGDESAVLARFASSPNRAVRDYVERRRRFHELKQKPFALAFTALDGREVDLQKLRGKIVLIDFWATWCGPCIAELPNVKRVYAEYHDRGFEIVGISLDHEKDRQKFIDLVAKEGLAWPQRFEGKGWKDSFAVEYTIMAVPAMFLLDQQGRLVTTDARGEKLEAEVRRLLAL